MDSLKAFEKAQRARVEGNATKYYDYKTAYQLIKERKPTIASFYMGDDRSWTEETIFEKGKFVIDLTKIPGIAGIDGSVWATPMLCIDGEDIECWTFEKPEAWGD